MIPEVPSAPVLPPEPVKALEERHGREGIRPDAWTATPLWNGERMDYGLALDMLRHPLARKRQAQAARQGREAAVAEDRAQAARQGIGASSVEVPRAGIGTAVRERRGEEAECRGEEAERRVLGAGGTLR